MNKSDFRLKQALQFFGAIVMFLFLSQGGYGVSQEKIFIGHHARMFSTILEKEIQLSIHIPVLRTGPFIPD